MTFVPQDELNERGGVSLAPMIDFLFLMLAVFASLAVTRIVLKDTEIDLVRSKVEAHSPTSLRSGQDLKLIHVSVMQNGNYKWVTEIRDYPMETAEEVAAELLSQYDKGLLPKDKLQTQVLLKIDREAQWEPILKVLLAVKELGFEVRPVYEPQLN
jgi:biopolymer transport protein ExbD